MNLSVSYFARQDILFAIVMMANGRTVIGSAQFNQAKPSIQQAKREALACAIARVGV